MVRQMSQVYVTGLACGASDVTGLACANGVCASDVTGLACGASDVTGLACVMASVRQMSWRLCVRCHGVRASDVKSHNVKVWHVPNRFGVCASDVRGLASVRQMSWRPCVRCHVT